MTAKRRGAISPMYDLRHGVGVSRDEGVGPDAASASYSSVQTRTVMSMLPDTRRLPPGA